MKVVPTYQATIHIAGDVATARAFLRREAIENWLCVSLTPTEFVFTSAVESGMAIGFVNYPETPSEPEKIFARAKDIAIKLISQLGQRSALVVGADCTEWIVMDPPAWKTLQNGVR